MSIIELKMIGVLYEHFYLIKKKSHGIFSLEKISADISSFYHHGDVNIETH